MAPGSRPSNMYSLDLDRKEEAQSEKVTHSNAGGVVVKSEQQTDYAQDKLYPRSKKLKHYLLAYEYFRDDCMRTKITR